MAQNMVYIPIKRDDHKSINRDIYIYIYIMYIIYMGKL